MARGIHKFPMMLAYAATLLCALGISLGGLRVSAQGNELVIREPTEVIDWPRERQFWAFQPPRRMSNPVIQRTDWPRRELDFFVAERMERAHFQPSVEADRKSWLRRVTLDLTGLPPTPTECQEFFSDTREDALERVVDRLLASPRFGERMASVWLPLARYAEDQAHQVGDDTKSFYPNAYRYRSWVIDAFNQDLPYDKFVRFQLAADRYSEGIAHLAALGFLGLGPKYYNRDRLEVQADEWEDRVDTVSRTFLGLTVACARCHDHKFEPITMRDYYGMAGVFASVRMLNRTPDGFIEKSDTSARRMLPDTLHLVDEGKIQDLNVFLRGRPDRKGPVVERSFLEILSPDGRRAFQDGSGRRELAERLVDRSNPLTARVWANRIWGMMIGRPLVATPSNFGHSGSFPTHPELLDYLATHLVDRGWSTKALIREIALSATYRQSCDASEQAKTNDPENFVISHMNRRRLGIEQWRDTALFVSGQLSEEGRASHELEDPQNIYRTVYARISRLRLDNLLMQFDYPDANVHSEKRSTTTSAMQKLFMLNSPFIEKQAAAFANRLTLESDGVLSHQVRRAYQLLFGRLPDSREISLAEEYLLNAGRPGESNADRLQRYAQVLLVSNEMLYVE